MPTATGDGLQVIPAEISGPKAGPLALRITRPPTAARHVQAFPVAGWDTAKVFFDSASARTQAASLTLAKTALTDDTASALPSYAYAASGNLPVLRPASDYAIGVDLYASATSLLNGFGFVTGQTLSAGPNTATVTVTNNLDAELLAGSLDPGDRNGTSAVFNDPNGLAFDASGDLIVVDSGDNRIRKIDLASNVTTIAGNGTASAGYFTNPQGAVYYNGCVYVANGYVETIAQIDLTTGVVNKAWAGRVNLPGHADGSQTTATFNFPKGITVDASGDFFVADSGNNLIREISGGNVTTLAGIWHAATSVVNIGSGPGAGYAGAATFSAPSDITIDASGNLYVADTNNNEIRLINQSLGQSNANYVTLYAGGFNGPSGVALNAAGDLFVSDKYNHQVDKVQAITRTVTKLTSNVQGGVDGTAGTAGSARFATPSFLTCKGSKIYLADVENHAIRTLDVGANAVLTVAGGQASGKTDGLNPTFRSPVAVTVDATGDVYVADYSNNAIRKIFPDGTVTTLAVGNSGYSSGNSAHIWALGGPSGLALDKAGNLYVADSGWWRIQQLVDGGANNGIIDVTDGPFGPGTLPCAAYSASMENVGGLAIDASGTIYAADTGNNRIIKITGYLPNQAVGAGGGTATLLAGGLNSPQAVCVDLHGNVYVADEGSATVKKITPAGIVSTIAASPAIGSAYSVACDGVGNVFVCDPARSSIEKIDPTGVITLVAGGTSGSANGIGGAAQFFMPYGIAVDASDVLYVADRDNHVIRIIH